MKIKINGKEQTIEGDSISVNELLCRAKVENPDMVSVQLNGEFVSKDNFASTSVKENDEVDFLYFMGGGSAPSPHNRRFYEEIKI